MRIGFGQFGLVLIFFILCGTELSESIKGRYLRESLELVPILLLWARIATGRHTHGCSDDVLCAVRSALSS